MTPQEFKRIIFESDLCRAEIAKLMGVSVTTIYNWRTGLVAIDKRTEIAIKELIKKKGE